MCMLVYSFFMSHVRQHDVLIRVHRPRLSGEAEMGSFAEFGRLLIASLLYGAYGPLWAVNVALKAVEGCGDGKAH